MISPLKKDLNGPDAPANDGPKAKSAPAHDGTGGSAPPAIVTAVPGTDDDRQVDIPVTKTDIEYEDGRSKRVGYLRIEPGDPPMTSRDGDTVLHLLFYLTYTDEGRSLLLEYTFDRDAKEDRPVGNTRATLKALLRDKFPYLGDDRLEIALDAHFAAGEYVATRNDPGKAEPLEGIYKQKLAAMLGALHDDSMGRDFSCIW
jgi:hypothetical protein